MTNTSRDSAIEIESRSLSWTAHWDSAHLLGPKSTMTTVCLRPSPGLSEAFEFPKSTFQFSDTKPIVPGIDIAQPSHPSRRPKLSLNTADVPQWRTFGKGSTNVRLDRLSQASPTSRNTLSNACNQPTVASSSPRKNVNAPKISIHQPSTHGATLNSIVADVSEKTTTSEPSVTSLAIPYHLASNVQSILSNSPLGAHRAMINLHSGQPPKPSSGAKVVRPRRLRSSPSQKVSFRQPLVEEIHTERYIARHSDLSDEEPLLSSPTKRNVRRKGLGVSYQRPAEYGLDGETADSDVDDEDAAKTPLSGKRKRCREWVWTIGPSEEEC